MFFDGHYSHATSNLQLLEACLKHNEISAKKAELLCFPSGQTDKLQPLDKVPFGGMKQKFKRYKNFYRIMDPNFEVRNGFLKCVKCGVWKTCFIYVMIVNDTGFFW